MLRSPVLERAPDAIACETGYRVIMGDTDAMGIVYYANYLRLFELGRSELMRHLGIPYGPLFESGILMPIAEQWWRYRAPARFDDWLRILTWGHEIGRTSILVGCEVYRDQTLIGQGACRLACMDREGRLRKLPPELLQFRKEGAE